MTKTEGLTPNHIRRAESRQIAQIFGTTEQTVYNWRSGNSFISGKLLEQASLRTGLPKEVLIRGLDLFREDYRRARDAREEVGEFLRTLKVPVSEEVA